MRQKNEKKFFFSGIISSELVFKNRILFMGTQCVNK